VSQFYQFSLGPNLLLLGHGSAVSERVIIKFISDESRVEPGCKNAQQRNRRFSRYIGLPNNKEQL